MNDQQVIFSMVRVNRVFPPNNKQVIRDISLGFYYGAKIGVLGLNGSGKSTLLANHCWPGSGLQRRGDFLKRLQRRFVGTGTSPGR